MQQTIGVVKEYELIVRSDWKALVIPPLEGKRTLIIVSQIYGKKTRRQLGYYYAGVCTEAALHFGYEGGQKQMHEVLKQYCNPIEAINQKSGEVTIYGGSTKDMDKYEYSLYIDRCVMKLAEWGYVVKTPDEYYRSIDIQPNHRTEPLL